MSSVDQFTPVKDGRTNIQLCVAICVQVAPSFFNTVCTVLYSDGVIFGEISISLLENFLEFILYCLCPTIEELSKSTAI